MPQVIQMVPNGAQRVLKSEPGGSKVLQGAPISQGLFLGYGVQVHICWGCGGSDLVFHTCIDKILLLGTLRGARSCPRILRIRCHQLQLRTSSPHAPGVRMTIVTLTPSNGLGFMLQVYVAVLPFHKVYRKIYGISSAFLHEFNCRTEA